MKYILIAGSRNFNDYDTAKDFIDLCIINVEGQLTFISGGCRGADALGERYALEHDIPLMHFPAEWDKYGKAAGPIRNEKMGELCDILICFWDGESRGTAYVIDFCKKKNKKIFIKFI